MKDIKSLYENAKRTLNDSDIQLYIEAINEAVNSNPIDYVSNIEYIIKSNIGFKTLNEFVSNNGLPIPLCKQLKSILEEVISKNNDDEEYHNGCISFLENLNNFLSRYSNCINMYEYFTDESDPTYITAYYKNFNKFKESGNINYSPMIQKYGEGVMGDILIYNNQFADVNNILENMDLSKDSKYYQWITECCKDIFDDINTVDCIKPIIESNLDTKIKSYFDRKTNCLKESVLTESTVQFDYTNDDLATIEDIITINEYKLLTCESTNEVMNSINTLYEEVINMEDVANNILPMLPQQHGASLKQEADGNLKVPSYINKNKAATYGEDDDDSKDVVSDEDDFIRPSAKQRNDTKPTSSNDTSYTVPKPSTTNTNIITAPSSTEPSKSDKPDYDKSTINNYYYNYTNSYNKNSNSNNKSSNKYDTKHITYNNKDADENKFESVCSILEDVGDADDNKPESDNKIRDTLIDIDRKLTSKQQEAKKTIQAAQQTGKTFIKPVTRTSEWVNSMVMDWKNSDENKIKEKMADPRSRSRLFTAIKTAILGGSLLKAGLLLNPVFIFLAGLKLVSNNANKTRLRNEIIGELKTELTVVDEKIKDADRNGDNNVKYQLIRLKNDINKKLIRVGGDNKMRKLI